MIISKWIDTKENEKAILDLARRVYSRSDIINSSYFDWQYRKNSQGKAIIMLGLNEEQNNSVIGIASVIPMSLSIDREIILGSLACNVAIHPDFRMRGNFSKLLSSLSSNLLENNIHYVYAVLNKNSYRAFMKQDYIEVIRLPLLAKPLKISKYFNNQIQKILSPFDRIWKIKNNHSGTVKKFNESFNEKFEKLIEKKRKIVHIIHSRDQKFLHWRYQNHPTRKYQIFILEENQVLSGYIITTQAILKGKKIGVIVDFICDEDVKEKNKFQNLINTALEDFWKNDVSIAIALCGVGLFEYKMLHDAGFFRVPQFLNPEPLHFVVLPVDQKLSVLKDLNKFENWFFTFGDYDIF